MKYYQHHNKQRLKYVANFLLAILCLMVISAGSVGAVEDVWIDTDPACGQDRTDDVDDCWALVLAFEANEFNISGISTVFGNETGKNTYQTAKRIEYLFGNTYGFTQHIFRGADAQLSNTDPAVANDSTRVLAKALGEKPQTILALGPLTNVANLLLIHPDLAGNIKQIIAVAGQRPSDRIGFYPGESKVLHLHDMNFRKDIYAFDVILNSSVPLTLIPYEIAIKISINNDDLNILNGGNERAQWLARISHPWLEFWQKFLHTPGFSPFDSLAVGYLLYPELFSCEEIPVAIQHNRALFVSSRDKLIVDKKLMSAGRANYCFDIAPNFKEKMIEYLL